MEILKHQAVKFIIVGILNTIIGYSVYFLCVNISLSYSVSLIVSYIIGIINSFYFNNKWTFSSNKTGISNVIKFISVYIISFIINYCLLFLLVSQVGIDPLISQCGALFITTLISYFGQKYWTFKTTTSVIGNKSSK